MSAPHQYIVIDDDDDAIELESDFHLIDSGKLALNTFGLLH